MPPEPSLATPRAVSDVSIIVATRNRCADLKEMLDHLGRATVPAGWQVELIVVDNGSSDDTRAVAMAAELPHIAMRYIHEPRPGKVHALTAGIEASSGRALLMTDDDVHVPANWIEAMCRPILADEADAVQGGIRIAPHLERAWLTGALRYWVAAVEHPDIPPEGLVGANMACSRKALDAVGPLDARLGPGAAGFYEDTVLGWKLERAGYRKAYLPGVAVEHHFQADRLTIDAFMDSARRMAVARVIVDSDSEPAPEAPSVLALIPQLPGLAARSLTQLANLAIARRPDAAFMSHYYRLALWREQRRAAAARVALAEPSPRSAR